MKRRLFIGCIGALFMAGITATLIAQQKTDEQKESATERRAGQAVQPGSPQTADEDPAANKTPEQKFVSCSALTNLFEIQAGRLVARKATNPEVKKLAQMMVDDHTKAQAQLKETAQKSNIRVPERLLSWQQAKLDYISRVPAEDLEAGYTFHLVGAHHMAILETEHAQTKMQDDALKQLAQNQVRDLQGHLQHANTIAMTFTGGRGGRITGEPASPRGQDQPDREKRNQGE